jgi:hypothetical protein
VARSLTRSAGGGAITTAVTAGARYAIGYEGGGTFAAADCAGSAITGPERLDGGSGGTWSRPPAVLDSLDPACYITPTAGTTPVTLALRPTGRLTGEVELHGFDPGEFTVEARTTPQAAPVQAGLDAHGHYTLTGLIAGEPYMLQLVGAGGVMDNAGDTTGSWASNPASTTAATVTPPLNGSAGTAPRLELPALSGSGSPTPGETITAPAGGAGATYQWLRDGQVIKGATSSSYQLTTADQGSVVLVRVVAGTGTSVDAWADGALQLPQPAVRALVGSVRAGHATLKVAVAGVTNPVGTVKLTIGPLGAAIGTRRADGTLHWRTTASVKVKLKSSDKGRVRFALPKDIAPVCRGKGAAKSCHITVTVTTPADTSRRIAATTQKLTVTVPKHLV